MKKNLFKFVLSLMLLLPAMNAMADIVPNDVATIEALIDLHKTMMDTYKSGETQEEITAASQFSVKELSEKVNNVKHNLHLKLSKGVAVIQQVSMLATLVEKSYHCVQSYTQFLNTTVEMVRSKPLVLLKAYDVTKVCQRKINKIKLLIEYNTAAEANIMRLDDKERMDLLYRLKSEISSLEDYLAWQSFFLQMSSSGHLRFSSIWDIMNSEALDQIAANAIALMS
jgi:hypothetical protein